MGRVKGLVPAKVGPAKGNCNLVVIPALRANLADSWGVAAESVSTALLDLLLKTPEKTKSTVIFLSFLCCLTACCLSFLTLKLLKLLSNPASA